jgi:hypothetical protein
MLVTHRNTVTMPQPRSMVSGTIKYALVRKLLTYAAESSPSEQAHQILPCRFKGIDYREFQWVVDAGLAPLLYLASRGILDYVPEERGEVLLSADLTAQIRHGNLIDTANEIIDAGAELGTRVTLLKGISTSDQFYPAAHLRPMADVDVLVPAHAYDSVETAILLRGYCKSHDVVVAGQQHGAPLYHPERNVWVELHTRLFGENSHFDPNRIFSETNVSARSIASMFHGRAVNRLAPELQLVYIACSWINDLTVYRIRPSFLASLFDAIYLLKATRGKLNWDILLGQLDSDMVIASLYVMLTYLAHCGFDGIAPAILNQLASRQSVVGPLQLRIIHAMLDHFLIGGRLWNLPLPPPVPGRFSLRYQWEKRVRRWMRARG